MAEQTRFFKSPQHKLVGFFQSARDKWRERAVGYHQTVRSLKITVRDLQTSRDSWKHKYVRERTRRLELEAQLEHPPPRTVRARLTSTPANRQSR
jgi:hypothetical protein